MSPSRIFQPPGGTPNLQGKPEKTKSALGQNLGECKAKPSGCSALLRSLAFPQNLPLKTMRFFRFTLKVGFPPSQGLPSDRNKKSIISPPAPRGARFSLRLQFLCRYSRLLVFHVQQIVRIFYLPCCVFCGKIKVNKSKGVHYVAICFRPVPLLLPVWRFCLFSPSVFPRHRGLCGCCRVSPPCCCSRLCPALGIPPSCRLQGLRGAPCRGVLLGLRARASRICSPVLPSWP